MRSAAGLPSSLVSYFTNDILNKHVGFSSCMESIAEKASTQFFITVQANIARRSYVVVLMDWTPKLPNKLCLTFYLKNSEPYWSPVLIVSRKHGIWRQNISIVSSLHSHRSCVIHPSSLLSLRCSLYFAVPAITNSQTKFVLFLYKLLPFWMSFFTQDNPVYEFHSDRTGITLELTDSYKVRNEILGQLQRNAKSWFQLALGRAPIELQSTLQVSISLSAVPLLLFFNFLTEISSGISVFIRGQYRWIGCIHRWGIW